MTLIKTEAGLRVLKDRSVALTPRQRAAFILCDGKNSQAQVLAATAQGGVTQEDLKQLVELGLVADTDAPASEAAAAPEKSLSQRYQEAYQIATRLTAALGLKGFRLNLAVEGACTYDQLREVAPRIRDAVGDRAYAPLAAALQG